MCTHYLPYTWPQPSHAIAHTSPQPRVAVSPLRFFHSLLLFKPPKTWSFANPNSSRKNSRSRREVESVDIESTMEIFRVQFLVMALALALALVVPSIGAESPPPAPAPTSDGVAVDQGIAYVLMLLALVLTYIIH